MRELITGGAAWSSDGLRIAFYVNSKETDEVLFTTARDGSDKRVLVRGDSSRLVAEHPDMRDVYGDVVGACYESHVVTKPGENTGLVKDCATLLSIRDALAGDATLNWGGDHPISEWTGVAVRGDPPRVAQLNLAGLEPVPLTGIVPPELGKLSSLWKLALSSNSLSGTIPPELGSLSKLEVLDLSSNDLSGSIPAELGKLSNLRELYLSSNALTGGIPRDFSALVVQHVCIEG